MENFVSGILISNNPYTVYEDSVWDRYLRFQLDTGQILRVFDPMAYSGDLIVGERYQVILKALDSPLQYIEKEDELSLDEDKIYGKIRSLYWMLPQISSGIYHMVNEAVFSQYDNQPLMLIETRYGTIIMSLQVVEQDIKKNLGALKIGAFLQWKESRFDFVAALDPLA